MSHTNTEIRILGGLYGPLISDAVGVPYEFREPHVLPALECLDLEPTPGHVRAHPDSPHAAWSDDGAQARWLLATLLHCSSLDLVDFGGCLV